MQLTQEQPDGATLRAHLQACARATGVPYARLLARPPQAAGVVVNAWLELASAAQSGMGRVPVPPSEIAAWQANHRVRLTPWEIDTLVAMDRAAQAAAEPAAGSAAAHSAPPIIARRAGA